MIIFDPAHPEAPLQRLDPRARVLATLAVIVLACGLNKAVPLAGLAGSALLLALASGLAWQALFRRLRHLNLFMGLLCLCLPLAVPGAAAFHLGPFTWSEAGLAQALCIAARANTIVLAGTALLGSMDPAHLGFALQGLGVPDRLCHLFLVMARYTEGIHREYHRLRDAMRLRGFRTRCSAHSLRSLGHLFGMLIVRSADRAERVLDAMKCRGFDGRFYVLTHFRFRRADGVFLGAVLVAGLGLLFLEAQG